MKIENNQQAKEKTRKKYDHDQNPQSHTAGLVKNIDPISHLLKLTMMALWCGNKWSIH